MKTLYASVLARWSSFRSRMNPVHSYPISNGVKKFLIIAIVLFATLAPHPLLAATTQAQVSPCKEGQFCALAPIPGLTSNISNTTIVQPATFATFFNNLYKYLIGFAASLAVLIIIWSGIKIAMNRDSVSVAISSKGNINQAILGLILVLSPVLVFSIINPSILNLSLDVPVLDLSKFWDACKDSSGSWGVWNPSSKECVVATDHNGKPIYAQDGAPCVDATGTVISHYFWSANAARCEYTVADITACKSSTGAWGVWVTTANDVMGGGTCDTSQKPPDGTSCPIPSPSGLGNLSGIYDAKSDSCISNPSDTQACQAPNGDWGVQALGFMGSATCDTSQKPPDGASCTVDTGKTDALGGHITENGIYNKNSNTCVIPSSSSSGAGSSDSSSGSGVSAL